MFCSKKFLLFIFDAFNSLEKLQIHFNFTIVLKVLIYITENLEELFSSLADFRINVQTLCAVFIKTKEISTRHHSKQLLAHDSMAREKSSNTQRDRVRNEFLTCFLHTPPKFLHDWCWWTDFCFQFKANRHFKITRPLSSKPSSLPWTSSRT